MPILLAFDSIIDLSPSILVPVGAILPVSGIQGNAKETTPKKIFHFILNLIISLEFRALRY